jgi:hypothetical protein
MNRFRLLRKFALGMLALLLATSGDLRGATTTTAATTAGTMPPPREVTWQKTAEEVELGEMEMPGAGGAGGAVAVVKAPTAKVSFGPGGGTVRVLEIAQPEITQSSWAIEGKVRYANVVDNGYIEMWSHFPDGSAYFSRTLDTSGPLGVLHGKSEWREFRLPFFSQPGKVPSKLEVNVVLPSGGTVWLGPAKLKEVIAQSSPAADAIKKANGGVIIAPWWNSAQGGRIGGILGTVLGLYGALIGTLGSRGRGRRLGISLMSAMMVLCALMFLIGTLAWSIGQPYAVWYPLLLCGAIGGIVSGSLLPVMKRRFEEIEMRRMTALDA